MPELPEVEFARIVAHNVCVGRRIVSVDGAEDPIVFDGQTLKTLKQSLEGRRIVDTGRRGKYLWLALEDIGALIVHLGMTGAIRTPETTPIDYQTGPRDHASVWPPRFVKLHFFLDDGSQLAITSARRFGRVRIVPAPLSDPGIAKLGFDPLINPLSPTAFNQEIKRRKATMKGILLDQRFAAGVGNWIADEVLYQARVAPHRQGTSLSDDELSHVRESLLRVIQTAVDVNADKARFPTHWLFHYRWGKDTSAMTPDGDAIRFDKVAGRTTAWVPNRQR
jgi:formamidopyrimidine-DNA glycosylase